MTRTHSIGLVVAAAAVVGCVGIGGKRNIPDSTSPTAAVSESTDVQALAAVVARLETEITALKVGGDVKGVEYNSVFPIGVAASFALLNVLQAIQNMLSNYWSHKRELQRIEAGRA